jgi:hypothetical protein
MMRILNRPMIKEVLILVLSGVLATMLCGKVFAAPASETEQTASVPAQEQPRNQLPPMSQEEGRQMLLSTFFGQVPLSRPAPAPVPDR